MRRILLLFVITLLVGCTGTTPSQSGDPFVIVQEPYHVRLTAEPAPLRAGQEATFTVTVEEAASGAAAENVEIRPIGDMDMPTGMSMFVPLAAMEQVAPGQYRTSGFIEHVGTLTFSATIVRDGIVTTARFPTLPIEP